MTGKKLVKVATARGWTPTAGQLRQIRDAAAEGSTIENAARLIGTSARTMCRNDECIAAFEIGKQEAISKVAGKLITTALHGNVTAMIFYLKTQGGWIDRQLHEVNRTSTSQVNINVRALLEGKSEKEIAEIERSVRTLLAAGLVDQLGEPASNPEGMRGSTTEH